jgi:hypothetical protein
VTSKLKIADHDTGSRLRRFILTAIIYGTFAIYLYSPYLEKFSLLHYLLVVNVCLASLGCFVLSRRWVSSFAGSFFAGAVYGFGPFVLGLAKFHPTAGFLAATVPWFFCPAAFIGKNRRRWAALPLSALPFLAVLLFFRVSAHYRLFAVPIQARLRLADLLGLFAPLVAADRNLASLGFYHVPLAALLMGFAMLLAARRVGIMVILCFGTVLAFGSSFFSVSPIIWFTIPAVCCSVLIGVGMQGQKMGLAGFNYSEHICDRSITSGDKILSDICRPGHKVRKTLHRNGQDVHSWDSCGSHNIFYHSRKAACYCHSADHSFSGDGDGYIL